MNERGYERYFLDGWRPYAWIAGIIIALYAKSLMFGYTFLDDKALILDNYGFLSNIGNASQAFFQKVFSKSYLPYYRPLLIISFMVDARLGANTPFIYHLTNIAYHIIASCLVMIFLTRLGYNRMPSFLLSMIFAVHPVVSQGTAWIPGRNDTLLAIFVLASFIAFLGLIRTGRVVYYAVHVIFFLAALFTKETALVLVPVCILYLHAVKKEKLLSTNELVLSAGWAVSACVWYSFRMIAVRGSLELSGFDVAQAIYSYSPAALQFFGKIFFPFNLSVFPIIPDTTFMYGAAASVLLTLALFYTRPKRYNVIVFGFVWAVLFLLPSLVRANYLVSADFIEHRVYVPMVGILIVLLETDLVKKSRAGIQAACAAVIVAVFFTITFTHIDNFRDRLTFWSNAVKTSPSSYFAHLALGQAYHESGQLARAEEQYRKSLVIDPLEPASLYGLGDIYLRQGKMREAENYIKKSIAVYPFFDNAYVELGALYYKQGRLEEARYAWLRALEINPNNVVTIKFLAIYYHERKDDKRSILYVRQLQRMGIEPPRQFMESLGIR